jgi:hypothetical protein
MDEQELPIDERIAVAIGRLRRRSDVVFTHFHAVGRQPFGRFAKELPEELAAVYQRLGALAFGFRFVDEAHPRGDFVLRAPTSKGWVECETGKATAWPKWRTAGRDTRFVDEEGRPWPDGTRFAIVAGVEEGGVALRANPEGTFAYAAFDSDWQTRELGDAFEPLLDEAIARRFTGRPGRPDADALTRLEAEVPPRETLDVEVLAVEPLSRDALRAFVLGRWKDHAVRKIGKLLGEKRLDAKSPDERGRVIAEATAEDVDAARAKALLAPFSGSKTKKAYRRRYLLDPVEPHVKLALDLTPRRDEHGMGLTKNELTATGGFAAKVLLELLGPATADAWGVAPDRIRYATGTDAPWGEHVRGVAGTRAGARLRLELAVPAALAEPMAAGSRRALSVIAPFRAC